MVAAQRDGGGIHHGQLAFDDFVVAELLEACGIAVLGRVGAVNAVDLGGLQQQIRVHFHRAQRSRRIGGEEGVAGAGREQRDAAFFDMANGAAADEILGDVVDLDGAHHAGEAAALLDGILHGQCVHHRGQHAHMVAGDPVHARSGQAGAAEDVAAADHYADLHASLLYFDDFVGQAADDLGVDTVIGIAHQRLTGELEQDAAVL